MLFKTPDHIVETIHNNPDTPSMYIYDLEIMRQKMDALNCLPDNVDTHYAMKVNPHEKVVSNALKHENISWIEVASQWEINTIINTWEKDLSRVIYTGPGKKESELEFSVENSIKYLNVESLLEAVRINIQAEKRGIIQPVLLRLNTKHKFWEWVVWVVLWSWANQFWLDQDNAVEDLKILSKLKNIKVDWFHMYPATWIMEAGDLLGSVEKTFHDVKVIEQEYWTEFPVIDFGGWFWIDYGGDKIFDIEEYSGWLEALIKKFWMEDKTFILELGRFLWADMWYFVTKINDIKEIWVQPRWDEEDEEMFTGLICDSWTNALKRPQVLDVNYHIDIVKTNESSNQEIYRVLNEIWANTGRLSEEQIFNVYWPFCTSVDWIKKWARWHKANIWDHVVIPQTWAYGKSMSPQHFLSHPEVPEIIIND